MYFKKGEIKVKTNRQIKLFIIFIMIFIVSVFYKISNTDSDAVIENKANLKNLFRCCYYNRKQNWKSTL